VFSQQMLPALVGRQCWAQLPKTGWTAGSRLLATAWGRRALSTVVVPENGAWTSQPAFGYNGCAMILVDVLCAAPAECMTVRSMT
jgi:hypothetical protein